MSVQNVWSAVRRGLLLSAVGTFGANAFAGGTINNPAVAEIALAKQYGDFIFIRLTSAPSGQPACSNNGYWHFTLSLDDTTGKNLYALLLAATTSGKQLSYMAGTGVCSDNAAVEALMSFNVLN